MNLPLILDISIGLIFTYLILSLLASEIQELIATLLQWRAKHLKQAIDALLSGGSEEGTLDEVTKARQLADELYSHPLINTLNYQADRGRIRSSNKSIFGGKNSGPSYIPAETFATTLIETLKIPDFVRKASQPKLEQLKDKQLSYIESLLKPVLADQSVNQSSRLDLSKNFDNLKSVFQSIVSNSQSNKTSLDASLSQMAEKLDSYIDNNTSLIPNGQSSDFISKLKSFRKTAFNITNNSVLLGDIQPSLSEILAGFEDIKNYYKIGKTVKEQIPQKDSASYQKIQQIYGKVEDVVNEEVINKLPSSLIKSLSIIADRASAKVVNKEQELQQFQKEIEAWFDRSMDRSSGVYKRNAKGIALLLGLAIATATNADTNHMVRRLSKDEAARAIITQRAIQVSQSDPQAASDPDALRKEVETVEGPNSFLEPAALPFGWTEANQQQQHDEEKEWQLFGWYVPYLKRIFGWLLTSLAIAMGAPFWFDMLSRVVNVRNAGPKPASSSQDQPPVN